MILQNFILPDRFIDNIDRLYTRHGQSGISFPISLDKGQELDLRSYFNLLSLNKWVKYTGISSFGVFLKIKGTFKISIYCYDGIEERLLKISDISDTTDIKIENCPSNGLLGIIISSRSDGSMVYSGGFSCESEFRNNIRIGLDICTFNREQFVIDKLNYILAYLDRIGGTFSRSVELFVIDNSNTLFGKVSSDDRVHLIASENLGGSGGFTRGMMEIIDTKRFSHILINDDDAVFDPEALYRTWILASFLSHDHVDAWIGGTMLLMDDPEVVHESGARYFKRELISNKNGLNLSDIKDCFELEDEELVDYLGWWYCLVPCSSVSGKGYPLPLFIKEDDVEYSLRSKPEIIILGNISVWHDSFRNKFSTSTYYYYARNHLIIGCTTGEISVSDARWMLKNALFEAVCYRYECADMMFKGVKDFIKGPEFVFNFCQNGIIITNQLNTGNLNELRSSIGDSAIIANKGYWKRAVSINGLLLPSRGEIVSYVDDMDSSHFYRVGKVLYDIDGKRGFIAKRSVRKTISAIFEYVVLSLSVSFKFRRLKRNYGCALKHYTSDERWRKIFKL